MAGSSVPFVVLKGYHMGSKWFEEAFKPVTVTACQKQADSGTVCGYVYFPCSEENGCSAVTKGAF